MRTISRRVHGFQSKLLRHRGQHIAELLDEGEGQRGGIEQDKELTYCWRLQGVREQSLSDHKLYHLSQPINLKECCAAKSPSLIYYAAF